MANNQNLKPFKKGYDERRGTKNKGSKHISVHIREILNDEEFPYKLTNGIKIKGIPVKAMINALAIKAVEGDVRSFDTLAKYGYGSKLEVNLNENRVLDLSPEQAEQLLRLRADRKKLL